MLAEEYGYQVSPRPAAETPGVRAQVGQDRKNTLSGMWQLTAFFLVLSAVLSAVMQDLWPLLMPAVWTLLIVPPSYIWLVRKEPAQMMRVLETSRWQVWPCRIEKIKGTAIARRLLLLAPDKSVAAMFEGAVPHDVWLSMTDGRGVLWIAGDLRFPAVAAVPGGEPLWRITPVEPTQQPQALANTDAAFDALVAEARSAVVWNLLG
ncbi:hypothetical protein [Streptomyces sp. NPDC085937]|uniref:hypothetical protein n=1 Tax=Streptomyces sp. NPDC085937 TaxID=3365742 RepID=UPI0037D51803